MKMQHGYNEMYDLCKKHMHSYVLAELVDGTKMDGIITGLDEENVIFALPLGDESQYVEKPYYPEHVMNRQFHGGYGPGIGHGGGYGYPGYGYPGYGRPPQRFRRLVLPLAALTALSILPWY